MALPKVLGIETEFGVMHRGIPEPDPIRASSVVISAYLAAGGSGSGRLGWDFANETPAADARGYTLAGALPPLVEPHMVNAVLTNGARFYVDHAHPEYSSPECVDPRDIVVWDRAGEEIARRAMLAAAVELPPGQEIVLYKNNSDRKGNSYGCHENYLISRATPFDTVMRHILPFFSTRQIFCGAGKVGAEAPFGCETPTGVSYQLTQRADFFEVPVGLETTMRRPIVNTRDEPHADPSKYRRLHVIVGDANMSEVQTFLKVGTTAFVLCLIEDGWLSDIDLYPARPIAAHRGISYDLTLRRPYETEAGSTLTALAAQWEYLDRAHAWARSEGMEAVGGQEVGEEVLRRWEEVLTGLERDPASMRYQLDWVAKLELCEAYRARHSLEWDSPRLAQIDLAYHDMRPDRGLAGRVGLEVLVGGDEAEAAMTTPPERTRAWFRGRCLSRFGHKIATANWDSIVFEVTSGERLRRVGMLEPLRGTRELTGDLVEESEDVAQLLSRLKA